MAGVNLKHHSSRFPLFPSQAFQSVHPNQGEPAYEKATQNESSTEAIRLNEDIGQEARRTRVASQSDSFVKTQSRPAEGTEGESLRVKAQRLAVQFFLNWRHPQGAPLDPIRQHFYSGTFGNTFPRQSPSTPMPPEPQAQTPSPVSVSVASLPEILVGITARLSNVTFLSIWEINARRLVLFTTPEVPGLTLALDIDRFDGLSISKKVRKAQERFSAEER